MSNIVLTIATPDYAQHWRFCIDSQSSYCRREGYEHQLIDPTGWSLNPKWTKLQVALRFLDANHDVLLLDADAEIISRCPPFASVLNGNPSHDILFVKGISGRPNSGVLLLRGGRSSIASSFLQECLSKREQPVPSEDFVTVEGENGRVISSLKLPIYMERSSQFADLWNCSDPAFAEDLYIRHYTDRLREWRASMGRE